MSDPCGQEPVIKELQSNQVKLDAKVDQVLDNQKQLGSDLKDMIGRLTAIIEADIGTRMEVEQGKKEREILFASHRKDAARIEAIEIRNAKCDGLGVFDKFPKVWDFYKLHAGKEGQFDKVWNRYQQDTGIRRFVPAGSAFICTAAVIYTTWFSGG